MYSYGTIQVNPGTQITQRLVKETTTTTVCEYLDGELHKETITEVVKEYSNEDLKPLVTNTYNS